MPTRKLYYEDCHLTTFSAEVRSCTREERGFAVILSATAFYPEGGGQACDLGTLGDVNVLDVRERGEEVVHLCDGALPVGVVVEGRIQWERRFDLQQQHTGEHIVSGILHRLFGYHNTGFHVGQELMEVDFDGPLTPEQVLAVEQEANEMVWKNLPVQCWIPQPEELEQTEYRTKRALPWPVRIVRIEGVDSCACCGVHVKTTGEVGMIKIVSCVKFHQGVRLEMACGARAWRYMGEIFAQNRQISQMLSAPMPQTAQAVQKLMEQLAAQKQQTATLQKQVFDAVAAEFAGAGDVVYFAEDLNGAGVRELAERIANLCGGRAAVFSGADGTGYNYCLAHKGGDLRGFNKEMTGALSGRGGGKPEFQQGTVRADRAAIEAYFA